MRILMLGKGWFPCQLGGLDRYYRELLEHLADARGVVVGPVDDPAAPVVAASQHDAPLWKRVTAFTRAALDQGMAADVVDAHFALYAFMPVVLGGLRNKPLVVHFQGPWADENVAAGDTSRWRMCARRRLERAVYRRADIAITLTGAFRRLLVERYRVSPWKVTVMGPGVDLERFSVGDRQLARAELGIDPDAFVVCCVRRLVPRMGLDVLLEAWGDVSNLIPNSALLLAGEGELRLELEQRIERDHRARSVTLLGAISDQQLVSLYRAADVNVVPSVAFEGFGLVVLEAAACGTASVVTNVGGLAEAVAGLGEDLVVPAGDADALADRLKRAARGELPTRARTRTWAESHGWPVVARSHAELYARALDPAGKPRRLRVVYLDHVAQLSGGELSLLRLLVALRDVEAHVILAEEGPLAARLQQAGISVELLPLNPRTAKLRKHAVRARRLPLTAVLDSVLYAVRLARRLRQIRPDLVHTYSLKAGIYGSLAARLAGVPAVWHLHDRLAADYLPRSAVTLVRLLLRRLPAVVVTNSEVTRRTVGQATRSVVIPTIAEPAAPATGDRQAPLRIGIVGRLATWKGQDVFLRAFAQAFSAEEGDRSGKPAQRHGHRGTRGVVIGAPLFGEEELAYERRLRSLVEQLGIGERIEFRGHREDIGAELRELDILVHASTIPEPFGQVIVEGMSAGLPVVASRGGGPEEIITDGVDGLLYPRGDAETLAEILHRLGADAGLRRRLGAAARRRARDFAPDRVAPQIIDAYRLAIAVGRRARGGIA